ncbi:hypothetical protein ILUMI_26230 [Ignelater luminosus]|uniref:Uncharacterized protein n=1 Tax=Ignelater luminosus TaxID=2038154 RepID=A0A8K0FXG5_IGNLU|nr:hypothetical protein ILUMI_26230 [Ignelater luminosus]
MDTTEEDIHIEDLQIHTACIREKYTPAIKRLFDRCSRYSVKALGKPNPNLDDTLTVPELVFEQAAELYNQNKQVSSIKNMLEVQIKLLTVVKKLQNCPVAQKMKEV